MYRAGSLGGESLRRTGQARWGGMGDGCKVEWISCPFVFAGGVWSGKMPDLLKRCF